MPKVHPRIRARFKERARQIISSHNDAKKYGRSQNTIGEIERSMVEAYEMGVKGISETIEPATDLMGNEIVDWHEIPPRSREVLQNITYAFSQRLGMRDDRTPKMLELNDDGPRPRWLTRTPEGKILSERGYAYGPVMTLVKLGLLAEMGTEPRVLSLTELGERTCRDYWIRSDRNDPDLPLMSVR